MKKSKAKKLLSTLLALVIMFGLLAAMPLTANAEDGPFQVTENPVGAIYMINQTAVPLKATFEYDALAELGTIDSGTPIKIQWYWSYENSNTGRSNGFGENTVEYSRRIQHATTLTPATDTVGVKYYYAVLSYGKSVTTTLGKWEVVPTEVATEPARIEVIAPEPEPEPEPVEHEFEVKKVDEDGNLLSGAVISLIPDSNYEQDASVKSYEEISVNGYAAFTANEGYYILSEKQAPDGYNATDEKYYIIVTANGVFFSFATHLEPYETVTFVNKKIPTLNKNDHFAYMQGYTDGTFGPSLNMTRAEAVVMFSRLLTKKMNESDDYRNDYYPDVDQKKWYANQIGYMQILGVLADYSRDGNFRPNEPVTRAEFATLAAHFDNLILTDTNIFSDVPDDHWAVKYINSAAEKGWIKGYPEGTFKPEDYIRRAEVVTLVNRILERAADKAYIAANLETLPRSYSDLTTVHWAYLDIMEASIGHDFIKDGTQEKWTAVYK